MLLPKLNGLIFVLLVITFPYQVSTKPARNEDVADETSGMVFEGDIFIVDKPENLEEEDTELSSSSLTFKRNLRRIHEYLWVDRVIPYEISEELADNHRIIEYALDHIQNKSCLRFEKVKGRKNGIRFVNKGRCYSAVGRLFWLSQYQIISLAGGCLYEPGLIIHEVLHTLGFWHEQSRPDRDQYVEVLWENIAEAEQHNFQKYKRTEAVDLNTNYDYNSIMHYSRNAFSMNRKQTIVAIGDASKKLGQREHLSTEDIIKLNTLYKCEDAGKIYTSWSEWSPCNDDCMKSRQRFCSNYDEIKCPESSRYGVHTEKKECSHTHCNQPIDGHWGRWGRWEACSKLCDTGIKTRSRVCDDPEPKNGGADCSGDNSQKGTCYIKPCGLSEDDCQFDEQGMCFWEDNSVVPVNYKWNRVKGETKTTSTGPKEDHSTEQSTKDGYYMFTEASTPAKPGNKASLVSKPFRQTNERCLTFFYSMHGDGIGSLRVFIVTEGTQVEKKIWERQGPQGEQWNEAEIDFGSQFAYRIRFESERGPTYHSDIGLDDIYFRNSKCSTTQGAGTTQMPTTTSTSTTLVPTAFSTTTSNNAAHPMEPISTVCNVRIKPIGCFTDTADEHALAKMLDSHRPGSEQYHQGYKIDWKNFDVSLKELLCHCIQRAKDNGMKYIGLQYYGECWAGSEPTYNRHGDSKRCYDTKYKECAHPNKQDICVGAGQANYVYELL